MHADYAVEIGPDAPALEVPWIAPSGSLRFLDIRRQPELLLEVREATQNQEFGRFLAAINAERSRLQTVKSDVWITDDLSPEEDIFQARWKFGSYVDLIFVAMTEQTDFELHEATVKQLSRLLGKAPEVSAAAEFVIRRCYFHRSADPADSTDGCCITFYLSGYGDDEDQARRRWSIALDLVQNAIVQVTHAKQTGSADRPSNPEPDS